MKDIGTFVYNIDCGALEPGFADIWGWDTCPTTVVSVEVYNYPPTGLVTVSGTPSIHNTVTLNANVSSPEGDALTYHWRIEQAPAGHAATTLSWTTSGTGSTASITFIDERDIGSWVFAVDVDDAVGERKTFMSPTLTVPNLPPVIAIVGATTVPAGQPIALAASTTVDPAGGPPIELTWSILSAPTGAAASISTPTAAAVTIATGSNGIGDWHFKLVARDDEGDEASAEQIVTVTNVPPVITFDHPDGFLLDEGQTISITNTTPDDPDGGAVTSSWELVQAPVTASVAPRLNFQSGPTLTVPSARAGIWVFTLHVAEADNGGREVTKDIAVHVDAPPVANVSGPALVSWTKAFTIDGSSSSDAEGPEQSLYVTSRSSALTSPGIVAYTWSFINVPASASAVSFVRGPVEYSLSGVSNGGPGDAKLTISAGELPTGTWTLQLDVVDAEGGTAQTTYSVTVLDPNTPPIAVLPDFMYVLTDINGVSPSPVFADASRSYDPDNLLEIPYTPGITNYAWQPLAAPMSCPLLSSGFAGPSASTVVLFPASVPIPLNCQGSWTMNVHVTDDDTPALSSDGQEAITIGNCPTRICIDYPTESNPQYVEFADNADVTIHYHLNSAIYADPQFSSGLEIELALFHESDLVNPVYIGQFEYDPLPVDRGGVPAAHWHGFTSSGARPKAGKYTVRLRAAKPGQATPFEEAVATRAIWLEVVDAKIAAGSDDRLALSKMRAGQDHLHLNFSAVGQLTAGTLYDEAFLHIRDASTASELGIIPIPSPQLGSYDWTGELSPTVSVSPGHYTAEVEFRKLGHSIGTSDKHPFTAYQIDVEVVGVSVSAKQNPGTTLPVGATPVQATLTLAPSDIAGNVQLMSLHDPGILEVDDGTTPLATNVAGGVTFPSATVVGGKTLTVHALVGSADPAELAAVFVPADLLLVSTVKRDSDFVTIRALSVDFAASCVNAAVAATAGVFVQRNPTVATSGALGALRFIIQPIKIAIQPMSDLSATVTLDYETGDGSVVTVFDGATQALLSLPQSWTSADADPGTHMLSRTLLVNGSGYGKAVLRLRYVAGGMTVATRRIMLRVEDLPGIVGMPRPGYPYFLYGRTANDLGTISVALDPGHFPERVGEQATIYVVNHRSPAQWAADNSLAAPSVVISPIPVTIGPTLVSNIQSLGALPPGAYDVVYDFGNCPSDPSAFTTDAQLSPGDIVDAIVARSSPLTGQPSVDQPSLTVLPNAVAPGPLAIATAEYGVGPMPATTHVAGGYNGLVSDFDFRLRGRLVYPSPLPAGMLPLVVFAHGNHMPLKINTGSGWVQVAPTTTTDENYHGYTYLQEHLARRGYVTLSVDLDEMVGNLDDATMPASTIGYPDIVTVPEFGIRLRANVLLHNIDYVFANAATIAGGVLIGKIDPGRVYLVGHSRGGEAVLVAAALLANSIVPPTPYTLPLSSIRGIVSISPMSADLASPPPGIPYLLLYGSADGDVNGATVLPWLGVPRTVAWPFVHYDHAPGPAHLIYLIGANHNWFNSSWPSSDAQWTNPSSGSTISTGAGLLSASQEQEVAKAYILAFLKLYDQKETAYAAYFLNPPSLLRPAGLDITVPLSGATKITPSVRAVLDDYQTHFPDPTLASSGAPTVATGSVSGLSEQTLRDLDLSVETEPFNRFFQATNGVLFQWASTSGLYGVSPGAPPLDCRGSSIAFRIAQQPPDPALPAPGPVDFTVVLVDAAMDTSRVSASDWTRLREIYPSTIARGDITTKGVFETYVIPWWAFVADGRTLDLTHITAVLVEVGGSAGSSRGRVALDDLEIWKQ